MYSTIALLLHQHVSDTAPDRVARPRLPYDGGHHLTWKQQKGCYSPRDHTCGVQAVWPTLLIFFFFFVGRAIQQYQHESHHERASHRLTERG
jgi:hypothetical protein